ncbi:hypothetical protein [Robiginitomaculum antarcticum]|uniref:hypothetical protein n=1 Tax=Robiginitomaculum antarcticum TaxID=437507 RepID=UPI0012EAE232|nr:hypothetical protein [Robiginitomaculum antarcticum]
MKPFKYTCKISVGAENEADAKRLAKKNMDRSAEERQHPKLLDQGAIPEVEITVISGPFDKPNFPFGTELEWSKMSENYLR